MNPINRNLSFIAFLLGLAAVVWVAIGYVGSSALARFQNRVPSPVMTETEG